MGAFINSGQKLHRCQNVGTFLELLERTFFSGVIKRLSLDSPASRSRLPDAVVRIRCHVTID
jgi:hypothetical protein